MDQIDKAFRSFKHNMKKYNRISSIEEVKLPEADMEAISDRLYQCSIAVDAILRESLVRAANRP